MVRVLVRGRIGQCEFPWTKAKEDIDIADVAETRSQALPMQEKERLQLILILFGSKSARRSSIDGRLTMHLDAEPERRGMGSLWFSTALPRPLPAETKMCERTLTRPTPGVWSWRGKEETSSRKTVWPVHATAD